MGEIKKQINPIDKAYELIKTIKEFRSLLYDNKDKVVLMQSTFGSILIIKQDYIDILSDIPQELNEEFFEEYNKTIVLYYGLLVSNRVQVESLSDEGKLRTEEIYESVRQEYLMIQNPELIKDEIQNELLNKNNRNSIESKGNIL